jgi:hypothetical protein
MRFFEKMGAALGFGESVQKTAQAALERTHERAKQAEPFAEVEGPMHDSVGEEEWFYETADPRYGVYETYLESHRSLKEAPGSDWEKQRFLEMKIAILRDALATEQAKSGDFTTLVDLIRQWEEFANMETIERGVDIVGEIIDLNRTIEGMSVDYQNEKKKQEAASFEERLRVYLAKDEETRQCNDELDAVGYDVRSAEYKNWLKSTEEQRALWGQFSKSEQENLMDAGIHFKRGADMLREALAKRGEAQEEQKNKTA